MIKVKSLSLIKHYVKKTYWGVNIAPLFLTSALDGGECSASRLGHFTPGGKKYPFDKRLVGPENPPGRYGAKKNLVNTGNRTPAVARHYTKSH
jgi:hypothetical protein